MGYALASLSHNLIAGLRLALFMRVDRLRFRFDVAQVLLLFAVSALIDFVGDYLRAVPPRQFAIEGAGSELYRRHCCCSPRQSSPSCAGSGN